MPKDPHARYSRNGHWHALRSVNKQRPARFGLADFPDETVEVVMQQTHRGDERESHACNNGIIKEAPQVSERTKSQAQHDISQDQESARPKHETNEGTGLGIVACPAEVEEPDDRQVLNVVPRLEH